MHHNFAMRVNTDTGEVADPVGQAPDPTAGRPLVSSRKAWWKEMRWQAGRSYRRHKVLALCLLIVASESAVAIAVGDTPQLVSLYRQIA